MYTLGWSQDHPELGKNNFYTSKKKNQLKCVVDHPRKKKLNHPKNKLNLLNKNLSPLKIKLYLPKILVR